MIRRTFLATLAAVVVPAGLVAAAPPRPPKYHRFDRPNDRWVPVRKPDVKAGDHVWIADDGVYLCCEDAAFDPAACDWTFRVSQKVDPRTNQWAYL